MHREFNKAGREDEKVTRILILVFISLTLIFGATAATAQTPPPVDCDGPGSWVIGTITLTPDSGPPGTAVLLKAFHPLMEDPGNGPILLESEYNVFWVETGRDPIFLGSFPETIEVEGFGFTGGLTVPSDAAAGEQTVMFIHEFTEAPNCATFTVTESVGQDAYPAAATILPSTGMGLLLPIVGLAAGGLLSLSMRRRSRRSL